MYPSMAVPGRGVASMKVDNRRILQMPKREYELTGFMSINCQVGRSICYDRPIEGSLVGL